MPQHDLYLIRHGETEWSKSGRHTGRTDIPLTENGREQARRAGRVLAGRRFDRVLVSPMQRALDTAELAGYADGVERCDDLLEWDYGEAEGRKTVEIREERPGWLVWTGPIPGGETLEAVGARADRVIARVLETDGDVALFAHGHLLRILTARWCRLDPIEGRRFLLATATVTILGWEHDYPGIRAFNLTAAGS